MWRFAVLFAVLPTIAVGDAEICPDGLISVENGGDYTARVCGAAERAVEELRACNLPLERPVTVTLSKDIEEACAGLYHCGADLIEVLHPESLGKRIGNSALFSELGVLEYFDSIVFHELVHAAFDDVPCPLAACPATSEYLAYGLQIRMLSPEARTKIGLATVPDKTVSRDAINAIMVFWAPDLFAVKAWTHLMQRPDPCAYVGLIASGAIRFDHEPPFLRDQLE
jgi:hypothetical protein